MPAPTTVEEFADLIRKSAVLDDSRVSAYIQKLKESGDVSKDLNSVAGMFVRDGLLTYFQAEQFLQGRWKRFTIGKYKVLERLGSGGMGQVFLCEHKLMRRRVAVKVLPTAKAADPSSLERFYREARAVAALDHQNIVRAYDIDQDDNLHFIVMEYVDGSSLQDMIRKGGQMDPTRAAHYIYWSAIGLQHAHENGLIHRDIKPGNILVERQGVVKILDLGLARFFNDDQDLLTKKYDENILGTADYLAPEQAVDSHSVDGRADIYSLGATFYYMLTGQPPFAEGSIAQKLLWHQTRRPKSATEYRSDIPPSLVAVLEKMMAKKPEDRYATPNELAEALLPFTQTRIPPPPDEEMPTLSIAAMNGVGGSSTVTTSARTMVTAPRTPTIGGSGSDHTRGQTGGGSDASVMSDADTRKTTRLKPSPQIEPIPDSVPGTPVWESMGAETADAARDESVKTRKSDRSGKKPASSTKLTPRPKPKSSTKLKSERKLPIIYLAGGGVVALLAVVALLIYVFKTPTKPTSAATTGVEGGGSRQIVLTKSPLGKPLHFASLKEASEKGHIKPGDQVVIADDEWEELGALNRVHNITLSGMDGKRPVWKAPADAKVGQNSLLAILNCENVRISGITFQAAEKVEYGLRFTGRCPGCVVEDVEITDAVTANVVFRDCGADPNRALTLRGCRFADTGGPEAKAGILFETTPFTARPGAARFLNNEISIQNCRIEGPMGAGVLFEGGMDNVKFQNNRVYNTTDGIFFRKPRPEVDMHATVGNNTFHSMKNAGIRVEDSGLMKKPATKIDLEYNFFANVYQVGKVDGDPNNMTSLSRPNNYRKNGTNEGNRELLDAREIDVTLPADPTKKPFLLYDKNNPLSKAGQGKPVGATGE